MLRDGEHVLGSGPARTANLITIQRSRRTDHLAANLRLVGPEAASLIRLMLGPDPDRRPSAADALAHPFFWTLGEKTAFIGEIKRALDAEAADAQLKRGKGSGPLMAAVNSVGPTGMDEDWRRCRGLTATFWGSGTPGSFVKGDGNTSHYKSQRSDLVRLIRNLSQHFSHQRPAVQAELSSARGWGAQGAWAGGSDVAHGDNAAGEAVAAVREQQRAVAGFFVRHFPGLVVRLWAAQNAVRAGAGTATARVAAASPGSAASE